MNQVSPLKQEILLGYDQCIQEYLLHIAKLKTEKKWIALGRALTVFGGTGLIWYFWPATIFVFPAALFFTGLLIFLVFRDADKSKQIQNDERLIQINRHEIHSIRQQTEIYDDGKEFSESGHPYTSDLDLFGSFSLFQWMNRCHAEQSRVLFANHLKTPLPIHIIFQKQEAAKELAGKQKFCQQFQSTAMANPIQLNTERKLDNWMQAASTGPDGKFWQHFQNFYPVLPVVLFAIYLFDRISASVFLISLIPLYIFHFVINRKSSGEFEMLSHVEAEMETMYNQLKFVEKEKFHSAYLLNLQNKLKPPGYTSASASIRELNGILKKIDWRANLLVNALLQLFLAWDLRMFILLKQWKRKNENHISAWIQVIAETEVLISIASLVHNEPEWCFPTVDEAHFHLGTREIGHPLLPEEQRVTNDFGLKGNGTVALITGSNMAGKSTFLRTLGINMVLAMMGSPVCARDMRFSSVKLISSMRVADNLAENTSTFYAELKKLKQIIDLVGEDEHVFILLDEVLRGTNSDDRHKGTQALVHQLLQTNATTIMATHDTDLAHSESDQPAVFNYHFEGKISNDELLFDYKIKKGVCESLNATALMKKIGIHFQD